MFRAAKILTIVEQARTRSVDPGTARPVAAELARDVFCYVARVDVRLSFREIGDSIHGNRNDVLRGINHVSLGLIFHYRHIESFVAKVRWQIRRRAQNTMTDRNGHSTACDCDGCNPDRVIAKLRAALEAVKATLQDADIECLGIGRPSADHPGYPIRDEVLADIRQVLND